MASKINSGGLLEGRTCGNAFLDASGMPQGASMGGHLGVQNHSNPVWKRSQDATNIEKGFGIVLDTDSEALF